MADDIYTRFQSKANEIELALRRLNRWSNTPLPEEKYDNMGAFGINTMSFENWIQFILLQRISDIIQERGEFPKSSSVSAYAVRTMDGDTEAEELIQRLIELDNLAEGDDGLDFIQRPAAEREGDSIKLEATDDDPLPSVVYQLIDVLPKFDDDGLESQLQSYDVFLSMTGVKGRAEISQLLYGAAEKTNNPKSKERILKAAKSVANGGRAAAEYNHDEAMRKYREDFKKNFPDNP